MEPGPPALPEPLRPKAADGCAWQSLRCLRLHRQKKKVAYSAHIYKLLNRTRSTGDSCLVASALAWLGSPQLLRDVALEASRLSRCGRRSHLGHREVLLATKLVLLRELYKPPPGC
ncbi:histone H2B-like [Aphelocoma coerulescens]|uniref:histone H2B-like n=1 Tax=Aphelocoma coerulescens TaxID=39617 RepID=UPI003604E199